MALFDTADLLARCKRYARRPSTDAAFDADFWYALLTEAQLRQVRLIAAHAPHAMLSAPVLMTTADGGLTYTIPVSALPAGQIPLAVTVRASRTGQVLVPGEEWSAGADFTVEAGFVIRIPDGKTRSFSSGPYARFILEPGIIDGSHAPTLMPASARMLVVWDALEHWASIPGVGQDPAYYTNQYAIEAWGNPMIPGSIGVISSLKLQSNEFGEPNTEALWWRSPDLT